MSWLDEDYTEADAAQNSLKAVNRRIANRWYDTFPSDDEGSEGEVRNVYVNGTPLTAVKMNGSWHFQVLNTMGQQGNMRTDSGGIAGDFDAFMPNEPTLDTGFKLMCNRYPEDYSNDEIANIDKIWPCAYVGHWSPDWEPSFYVLHHGLGLSRPPKNIKTYVANLGDNEFLSGYDQASANATGVHPGFNCLTDPHETTGMAIWDGMTAIMGMRMSFVEYVTGEGIITFEVPPYNGEEVGDASGVVSMMQPNNLKSILTGIDGVGQSMPVPAYQYFAQNSGNMAVALISPNHILFSPMWQGNYNVGGYDYFEWARFMIWR